MRLYQRRLLQDQRVQSALRWRGEDQDAEVRRVAFLLSLYTRPGLLKALEERDPELKRQLAELASGVTGATGEQKSPGVKTGTAALQSIAAQIQAVARGEKEGA